jgi:hypothetical protein
MITPNDINDLCISASKAGIFVSPENLQLIKLNAGLRTHISSSLPNGFAAVYIFKWQNGYLKVGKVNANSNARYQSQHYSANSSPSNLAKTLRNESEFHALTAQSAETDWGRWIKENTTRFNILIPEKFGKNFVHFAEAFFILKCQPMFENTRA